MDIATRFSGSINFPSILLAASNSPFLLWKEYIPTGLTEKQLNKITKSSIRYCQINKQSSEDMNEHMLKLGASVWI